jgi:hypothetical protein
MYVYNQLLKKVKPYYSDMLNNMEIMSSNTTMFNLLLGTFYLEEQIANSQSLVLCVFILIVLINIGFILYWLLKFGPIIWLMAKSTWKSYKSLKIKYLHKGDSVKSTNNSL